MRNRRSRIFRHRSNNGRSYQRRSNDNDRAGLTSNAFSNGRAKNNFKTYQSSEKLLERYKTLAKEALSSGDKILSENYLQHADHFTRIISHKNLNQSQVRNHITSESKDLDLNLTKDSKNNQDKENK